MLGFDALGRLALGQLPRVGLAIPAPAEIPLSEPVRQKIKPALAIALIASGVIGPVLNPDTEITQKFESRWHQPWSEPVRFKPQLRTADQQFLFFHPEPAIFLAEPWFAPLSEPVRLKPGLRASLQAFNSAQTIVPPGPSKLLQGWYDWLSEPVRLPSGLKAYFQQTIAYHPRLLPAANVTIVMQTVETNLDKAMFGIDVYYTPPVPYVLIAGSNVTINEIPSPNGGALSIEET